MTIPYSSSDGQTTIQTLNISELQQAALAGGDIEILMPEGTNIEDIASAMGGNVQIHVDDESEAIQTAVGTFIVYHVYLFLHVIKNSQVMYSVDTNQITEMQPGFLNQIVNHHIVKHFEILLTFYLYEKTIFALFTSQIVNSCFPFNNLWTIYANLSPDEPILFRIERINHKKAFQ